MCDKICMRKIASDINKINIKKILESGENDMFNLKVNTDELNKILQFDICQDCKDANQQNDLKSSNQKNELNNVNQKSDEQKIQLNFEKSIENLQNRELLKTIIDLKNRE